MRLLSLVGHVQELLGTILKFHEPLSHRGKPVDGLIDTFFRSRKYLGSNERRFIAETSYGILRHKRLCEYALAQLLGEKSSKLPDNENIFLLITTYLLIIERRSDLPIEALLTHFASPAIRVLLPEVVRKLPRLLESHPFENLDDLGIRYSFPDWMVTKLVEQYGRSETEELLKALNEQAPLTLRVNTLKSSVEDCQERLRKDGIETTRTRFSPVGLHVPRRLNIFLLKAFKDGLFEVQDEGSQLLPILIDPKPTAKVLDACAGAGGKTLELSALMKNKGEIVATDLNGYRLGQLRKRARRAGAFNIRVQEIEAVEDLIQEFSNSFDVVLVDAPCSGLGTIRRNPGMKWSVDESTVAQVSQKQKHILKAVSSLVRPGGRLAYATCTLLKEENEDVVQNFLEEHPNFQAGPKLGADLLASHLSGETLDHRSPYLKLSPHRECTDGFFLALMQRSDE